MTRSALCAAAVLASLASPAMARAPQKPSSELGKFYLNYQPSVRAMFLLTQCLVNRHPDQAKAVLLAPYGSSAQRDAMQAFLDKNDNCLDRLSSMEASSLYFMGGLAEQLLARDAALAPVKADAAFANGGGAFVWKDKRVQSRDFADLGYMTACLVSSDPANVAALLATRGASEDERRQFNAMVPAIKQCVPADRTLSFEPITLRATLAYAWYVAPRWKQGVTVAWLGGGE